MLCRNNLCSVSMSILRFVVHVTFHFTFNHGIDSSYNLFWHLQQISSKFQASQRPPSCYFPVRKTLVFCPIFFWKNPLHPPLGFLTTTGEHEQAAWDWLKNLDGGRGSLFGGPGEVILQVGQLGQSPWLEEKQIVKPIGSMYGIFTNIWLMFVVNVGKYTIHGSYGKRNCEVVT